MNLFDNPALQSLKAKIEEEKDIITGTVKFTRQAFGFLEDENGQRTVFIPPPLMKTLLPGDVVQAIVGKEGEKEFVQEIKQLISFNKGPYIGRVVVSERNDKVTKHFMSNDPTFTERLPIYGSLYGSLKNNDWIEVVVTQHAIQDRMFKVSTLQVFGNESDSTLPWDFISKSLPINSHLDSSNLAAGNDDFLDYEDRIGTPYVTIDGESTKDMDDALYAEDRGDHWYLSVAISDPSVLIDENPDFLDTIVNRGFTFYLPKNTIHMLPRELSEHRFSLVDNEIRPTLCMDLKIEKETMEVSVLGFVLAMVDSKAKLSYEFATALIESNNTEYGFMPSLNSLKDLTEKLRISRSQSQTMFDDRADHEFVFDGYEPIDLKSKMPNRANRIVEECMILANTSLGEFAEKFGVNVVFNTNAGFKLESTDLVKQIFEESGFNLQESEFSEMKNIFHLQNRIKEQIEQASEQKDTVALAKLENRLGKLRSCFDKTVFKAVAEPQRIMGVRRYATWTSPLRKAGDCINHLNIKRFIRAQKQLEITPSILEKLNERQECARKSERLMSKMLFAKLLKNRPELASEATIKRLGKTSCLVELSNLGMFATLPINTITFEAKPHFDLDNGCVLVNNKVVLKEGDCVPVRFLKSDLLYQECTVTLSS